MVLDVDGTISRVYSAEEKAELRGQPGAWQWFPLVEPVIDALDVQCRRPGVDVVWLTSWVRDDEDLHSLIHSKALRGRLEGGRVPWSGWPARGWRSRSLFRYLTDIAPAAVIWADDLAPRGTTARIIARFGIPCLVLRPHVNVGLTMHDIERITGFLDGLQEAR